MKILYITNGINGPGGLERVLSIKASRLAENYDYTVGILVLNEGHQNPFYEFSPKIRFFSIPAGGNPLAYFKTYKSGIQKTVNHFKPEIISVCDDGLKGFFLPKLIKTPAAWIYERHVSKLIEINSGQSFFQKKVIGLKWKLMEYLGAGFSRFVVLTEGNKKEWPSLKNLAVISNPLSFYPDSPGSLTEKAVICVGKISYQKGQDLLLKIWKNIEAEFPGWELHMYGSANSEFLDTENLPASVRHFPPERDIESRYLSSSVYVMPSRFEGFGMVLTEAMACGLPCVSFDCDTGPGDIIQDGTDGFLVPAGDLKSFEKKLKILMGDEAKRKRFGKSARSHVKRYAPEVIVKQWDDLFRSLLKR